MIKRQHLRLEANNLSVDIADGSGFFAGVVLDFSKSGLAIGDLPVKINETAEEFTIVVHDQEQSIKMNVSPRWSNKDGIGKFVGAEILKPTSEWTAFVTGHHNELIKSVIWGEAQPPDNNK
jgi:hypothetical protein